MMHGLGASALLAFVIYSAGNKGLCIPQLSFFNCCCVHGLRQWVPSFWKRESSGKDITALCMEGFHGANSPGIFGKEAHMGLD